MRCVRRNPVRRGVVIVVTAVSFVVIIGFVALVIDLGRLLMVRTELQRVADSAAMAGASVYTVTVPINAEQVARSRSQAMSLANLTYGLPTNLAIADVVRGVYDFNNPAGGVVVTGVEADYNACDITVRCDGQINGTIPFLFAPLLGEMAGTVEATARAVFDDRVAGITPAGALTPFVIELNTYNDQIVNGTDGYSFDPTLSASPDGVPEIHLFPSAGGGGNGNGNGGGGNSNGAGNFGLLNIANPNQGTVLLGDQIRDGVTPSDLHTETGSSELTFYDDDGNPTMYQITGTPGIKAGLEPDVESRLGDVIGFFLYSTVVQGGANATYMIVDVKFGRVMYVELRSGTKEIVVQPVVYSGAGIRLDPGAPRSGDIGHLVLVR